MNLVRHWTKDQFVCCRKHTTYISYLKVLALHSEGPDDRHARQAELGSCLSNNLLRDFVILFRCLDYIFAKSCKPFVGHRGSVNRSREIFSGGDMKICDGSFRQGCCWTTAVHSFSNSIECASRHPCSAAFVSGHGTPASGKGPFSTGVDATANGACAGNNHQARLTIRGSIERNLGIADNLNLTDADVTEGLAHAGAKFLASGASQTDLSGNNIISAHLGRRTSSINCFPHSRSRCCDSHSKRVRRTSKTFAEYPLVYIHYYSVGLGASSIHPHDRILSPQPSRGQEIGRSAIGMHFVAACPGSES